MEEDKTAGMDERSLFFSRAIGISLIALGIYGLFMAVNLVANLGLQWPIFDLYARPYRAYFAIWAWHKNCAQTRLNLNEPPRISCS